MTTFTNAVTVGHVGIFRYLHKRGAIFGQASLAECLSSGTISEYSNLIAYLEVLFKKCSGKQYEQYRIV